MKILKKVTQSFILYFSFLLVSFSTSCATYSTKKNEVPDWVLSTPIGNSQYEYFTASGVGETTGVAEENAKNNIIAEVMRMLGVSITAETKASVFGDINNINKTIESEVTQSSSAIIKNLKLKNRYIERDPDKNSGNVTVYILAEYDKHELQKEKLRLIKLAEERLNSVEAPLKQANSFSLNKKYFSACKNYIQAAVSAYTAKLENAEIIFKQNVNNAVSNFNKLEVKALTEKFVSSENNSLPSVQANYFEAEIPILVIYTVKPIDGASSQKVRTHRINTNNDGLAEFILPLQQESCNGSIQFEVDVESMCNILKNVNNPLAKKTSSDLKKITSQKALTFGYKFEQSKTSVEKTNNIDVDVFIETTDTAGISYNSEVDFAVIDSLQKQHFNAKKVALESSSSDYLIVVRIRLDNIEKESSSSSEVFITLVAKVEILKNGKSIFSKRVVKQGGGFTEKDALLSAENSVAKTIVTLFKQKIK